MADIRISSLPNEPAPSGADFVPIDLATTRKTTITLLTEAGRPAASQAEAEAGTNPTKAMTPLTTAQAIAFQGSATFVPQTRTLTAGAGLTGGGNLTANRSFAVDFTAVQPFSTKLTNIDGVAWQAGDLLVATGINTFARLAAGTAAQVLQINGGVPSWQSVPGTGDMVGPASSVTGSIPTFNGTTGKILQAGNPTMADLLSAERGPMPSMANNGTDAVNDIDFSVGACFSEDATHWPIVAAARTKQLDAAWAVGTNAGGRMSAAAITNTTYHCYVIRRPDTGVVDFGFDVSATAPTLPANYTQYRRIGSIIRSGGTILAFRQTGDTFKLVAGVVVHNSTSAFASALLAVSVPLGISVQPIMWSRMDAGVSSVVTNLIGDAAAGSANIQIITIATGAAAGAALVTNIGSGFFTNTSGQLYWAVTLTAGTLVANSLNTIGWIDTRGA